MKKSANFVFKPRWQPFWQDPNRPPNLKSQKRGQLDTYKLSSQELGKLEAFLSVFIANNKLNIHLFIYVVFLYKAIHLPLALVLVPIT
jgi:hypothetical protein